MKIRTIFSSVGIALFGLPFALFGVFGLIAGIGGMARDQRNAWVGVVVGTIFTLVGSLFISAAFFIPRWERGSSALQAEFPDEPWKWNKAWREGRIADDSKSSIVMMWVFAVIWNAVSMPAFFVARARGDAGNAIWLISLFPLIGLGLIAAAFYMTARRWKYGRCIVDLETFPGRIGGWIGGTLQTKRVIDASGGMRVILKCINRVTTGSGKSSGTSDHVLWQEQQMLGGRLPRAGGGLKIPFAFQIPVDCAPTRDGSRNTIFWKLIATASEPGIDFKATFIVPVFPLGESAAAVPAAEALATKVRVPHSSMTRPHDARIRVAKDVAGRAHFEFPPGRNWLSSLLSALFAIIFGAMGVVAWRGIGSVLFAILFSLAGIVLAIATAVSLLRGRTIRILQDVVELRWSMMGFGRTRMVPRQSITEVKYKCHMTSGNTSYFQIRLVTSRTELVAAGGLRLEDAKWIAEELAGMLGVSTVEAVLKPL